MAVAGTPRVGARISKSTLHLVCRETSLLAQTIRAALPFHVEISVLQDSATDKRVAAGDLVIVDLTDTNVGLRESSYRLVVRRAETWLVVGEEHPTSIALAAFRPRRARVLFARSNGSGRDYGDVVDKLVYRFCGGDTGATLAAAILAHERALASVGDLVTVICERPRDLRRPRDLSLAVGKDLCDLRSLLRPLGFSRTEHFIIGVKMIAFEHLVGRWGVPSSKARHLLGLDDSANTRRQFRRAVLGSRDGVKRLSRIAG